MASPSANLKEDIFAWIRDWIIFAPIPIWAAAVLQSILPYDFLKSAIIEGALLCYAIGLAFAHVDDLPTSAWRQSQSWPRIVLGFLLPVYQWLISGFALVIAVILLVHAAGYHLPISEAQAERRSVVVAIIALLGSLTAILSRQGDS